MRIGLICSADYWHAGKALAQSWQSSSRAQICPRLVDTRAPGQSLAAFFEQGRTWFSAGPWSWRLWEQAQSGEDAHASVYVEFSYTPNNLSNDLILRSKATNIAVEATTSIIGKVIGEQIENGCQRIVVFLPDNVPVTDLGEGALVALAGVRTDLGQNLDQDQANKILSRVQNLFTKCEVIVGFQSDISAIGLNSVLTPTIAGSTNPGKAEQQRNWGEPHAQQHFAERLTKRARIWQQARNDLPSARANLLIQKTEQNQSVAKNIFRQAGSGAAAGTGGALAIGGARLVPNAQILRAHLHLDQWMSGLDLLAVVNQSQNPNDNISDTIAAQVGQWAAPLAIPVLALSNFELSQRACSTWLWQGNFDLSGLDPAAAGIRLARTWSPNWDAR